MYCLKLHACGRLARLGLGLAAILLGACGGGSGQIDVGKSGTTAPKPDVPAQPVSEIAAARFLEQASFGPTPASIARVQQLGFSAYIDEQFSLPASDYITPTSSDPILIKIRERFYVNAVHGVDQLRQRVAFALSQVFVVSVGNLIQNDAIVSYQRMLLRNAFGNYRTLLHDVTLNPTMGFYLDLVNNNGLGNPNENFAREVMQLFSIGTTKLNADGTEQLDAYGRPFPTYDQRTVEAFARALTGWTYPTVPGKVRASRNPPYFLGNMEANDFNHDSSAKTLLGGYTLPAGQTAEQDLNGALDNIFNHPNVGPYIGLRLIQHLVTSNPTPAYVQRVSAAFAGEGGTRGDLKSVIKAVLLDPEARRGDDPAQLRPEDGKLKEPILFMVSFMRALNVQTDGNGINAYYAIGMNQSVFEPPSVFNYYPPDHRSEPSVLLAPEFYIRTNPTVAARYNFVNSVLVGGLPSRSSVSLVEWESLAQNTGQLMDAIDLRLMHGTMPEPVRIIISRAVDSFPESDYAKRVWTALYLAATSSYYSIQH